MRILGIIPARGGSKGIPRKNLALLAGKPLLYYTARAAQQSRWLTRTILSSDNDEIITVGQQLGLDVPFVRPAEFATDDASSVDVVQHALQCVEEEEGKTYDGVCLLQPTAPLRLSQDIDAAITLLQGSDADAVISVAQVDEPHPVKMMVVCDGVMKAFLPDQWHERLRRQQLEPVYSLNGAVYCVRRTVLLEQMSLWGKKTLAYLMPAERSVNIDNPLDIKMAECILDQQTP